MKRRTIYVVVSLAVAATWVVGFGCWPVVTWSRLNCRYEDVDINSGRVRYQHYLLGLCVLETIEETSLSRLVADETEKKPAEWHRANTFSPMVLYSPHHRYHAAIFQISKLDLLWASADFTPTAKRQMGRDVLSLWQIGKGYFPVSDYLNAVESVCSKRLASKEPIDIKELPTRASILERRASEWPSNPTVPLRPLGNKLMVDKNGVIWDGNHPVGIWGVDGDRVRPDEGRFLDR